MHRDKKVGLALGVLLLGSIGAFFFRNEKNPVDKIPALKNPQKLDDLIAEKPRIPYLTGVETIDEPTRADDRTGREAGISKKPFWERPDFPKYNATTKYNATADNLARSAVPPDPIHVESDSRPARYGISVPNHNQAWEVSTETRTARPRAARQRAKSSVRPVRSHRTHRVRKGETLSSLAARYLGKSSRYHELFQANRDILKSPNDLQVGMIIKIPLKNSSWRGSEIGNPFGTTAADKSVSARTISTGEDPADPQAHTKTGHRSVQERFPTGPPARRFLPARRVPFLPRRFDNRSDNRSSRKASQGSKPKRRLSQLPPDDLPDFGPTGFAEAASPKKTSQAPPESPAALKPRIYIVQRGDNLEKIAIRYYGTHKAALKIYAANRGRLTSPNALREGMTLLLP